MRPVNGSREDVLAVVTMSRFAQAHASQYVRAQSASLIAMAAAGLFAIFCFQAIAYALRELRGPTTTPFAVGVSQIGREIFYQHFNKTIIGDCDFGCKRSEGDRSSSDHCETVTRDRCNRQMGHGCTMAMLFLGEGACTGRLTGLPEALSYENIFARKFAGIHTARAAAYKRQDSPDYLLEAGIKPVEAAAAVAVTNGEKFGIGVCTTLAAAGQRLLGLRLAEAGYTGARIEFMREQLHKDGHEYLIVTDAEDNAGSRVLVDYWYAAMDGDPAKFVLPVGEAPSGYWNLDKAKLAQDQGRDRVYIVPVSDPATTPPSSAPPTGDQAFAVRAGAAVGAGTVAAGVLTNAKAGDLTCPSSHPFCSSSSFFKGWCYNSDRYTDLAVSKDHGKGYCVNHSPEHKTCSVSHPKCIRGWCYSGLSFSSTHGKVPPPPVGELLFGCARRGLPPRAPPQASLPGIRPGRATTRNRPRIHRVCASNIFDKCASSLQFIWHLGT